jgi:serine/threonine protein kinase
MADAEKTPVKTEDFAALCPQSEYRPGTVLGERYRIVSLLGRGGMGLVYKVEQVFLAKPLALKTLDRRCISEFAVRRFQHEARAAFAVDHPNVIKVHDSGLLDDQTPFMAMDLIDGCTLSEKLKTKGSLSAEEAIPIFIQVCFGLAAAHDRGVVHRDIKPSNIMLVRGMPSGSEGSVKVLDFGIAKFTQHEGGEMQALTRTGEIFGSPLYMSPEQCRGGTVDHRADVYSLGCVLFETLTGTAPFIGDSALSTMIQHQQAVAPTLHEASLGADFLPELERIISKMLAKDPADRYSNLGVVAHELNRVFNKISAPLKLPETASRPKGEGGKNVSLSVNVLVLLLALTACAFALAGYFVHSYQESRVAIERSTNKAVTPSSTAASKPVASRLGEFDAPIVAKVAESLTQPSREKFERALALRNKGYLNFQIQTLTTEQMKVIAKQNGVLVLDLTACDFKARDLAMLGRMNLRRLIATTSQFDDQCAEIVSHWPMLRNLEVPKTNVTDKGALALSRNKSISLLEIGETSITVKGLKALSRMPLDRLSISGCADIHDADLLWLADSPITSLSLIGMKTISDRGLHNLRGMRHLQNIDLRDVPITAEGIKDLSCIATLGEIFVYQDQLGGSDALRKLRAELPSRIIVQVKQREQ